MTPPRGHHIAQLNVTRMLVPTDSPLVADFMDNLDPIIPSTDEAMERLAILQRDGPTADAFSFKSPFKSPFAWPDRQDPE